MSTNHPHIPYKLMGTSPIRPTPNFIYVVFKPPEHISFQFEIQFYNFLFILFFHKAHKAHKQTNKQTKPTPMGTSVHPLSYPDTQMIV